MLSFGLVLTNWLKTWIPMSEPSSSRDRGFSWKHVHIDVKAAKRRGECQFMVAAQKQPKKQGEKTEGFLRKKGNGEMNIGSTQYLLVFVAAALTN